jgi:hypothetical protein
VSGSQSLSRLLMPWAGLIAAMAGTAIGHQAGSDGTFNHCLTAVAGPVRLVGILCIAAMIVGGWASWTTLREPEAKPTLRLIAFVSIGMAALGIFALLLPLIASLILPPCFE